MFIKKLVVSMVIVVLSITSAFAYDFATGSGTVEDPYEITNLTDLIGLSGDSDSWDKYFIQTADIEASSTSTLNEGAGFSPIGFNFDNLFSGSYDGQGFTISGLYINRPNTPGVGLFGLTKAATIENIGLVDNDISGFMMVGGLVGLALDSTNINNCYTSGVVTETGDIIEDDLSGSGGLVGILAQVEPNNQELQAPSITNCYTSGSVTSTGDNSASNSGIGGLVGLTFNLTVISNSYSRATVTSTGNIVNDGVKAVGGLLGAAIANGGKEKGDRTEYITNCYSTGAVSGIGDNVGGLAGFALEGMVATNSFWNTETSGQETSALGTGKTTAEMKDVSLFSGATWDITVATGDSENVWKINPALNYGYPYLTWAEEIMEITDDTLPVTLSSFSAIQTSTNLAQINWITASESGLLGYNLFRAETNNQDDALRVTATMIEATNSATGANYSYLDTEVDFDIDYHYWLQTNNFDGHVEMFGPVTIKISTNEDNDIDEMLLGTQMFANYPNPFNPSTTISFSVAESQVVTIDIYNIKGQLVKHVFNDKVSEVNTKQSVVWNGRDSDEHNVASGIYFTIMKTGNKRFANKSILIK
ncbi:T9SS type A sorting domain-containing protein [bacterium]|nr:T9SS type A sorting domain-containing protein [bacterium]